ncbi:MAG: hypothetical protein WCI73_08840 [Phycisphaerae bacterium]
MQQIYDHYDGLFTEDAILDKPTVEGNRLLIPAKGLVIQWNHPLRAQTQEPVNGLLIFEGVVSSTRTVTGYIGDPQHPTGFKTPLQESDGPFAAPATPVPASEIQKFKLEGSFDSPPAEVDWQIKAKRFMLQVENL